MIGTIDSGNEQAITELANSCAMTAKTIRLAIARVGADENDIRNYLQLQVFRKAGFGAAKRDAQAAADHGASA